MLVEGRGRVDEVLRGCRRVEGEDVAAKANRQVKEPDAELAPAGAKNFVERFDLGLQASDGLISIEEGRAQRDGKTTRTTPARGASSISSPSEAG